MKKISLIFISFISIWLLSGCAVYTPYAPAGYYSYPAYSHDHPRYYGPSRYGGWGGHHHGWHGGGYGWRGNHGWGHHHNR